MKKPFKYTIICNKTGEIVELTNITPLLHQLQTWEEVGEGVSELTQTKTAYMDIRYEAKLRLFNYLTFTKNGLKVPKYRPFSGTQIGISTPILNF